MSYVLGLKCKECGHRVPVSPVHVCEACFGPYEVEYDYAKMKGKVTRESIARGPKSLWRYRDLLPVEGAPQTGFHSGFTPLKKAGRLGAELAVRLAPYPQVGSGHPLAVAVRMDALHFFDDRGDRIDVGWR